MANCLRSIDNVELKVTRLRRCPGGWWLSHGVVGQHGGTPTTRRVQMKSERQSGPKVGADPRKPRSTRIA